MLQARLTSALIALSLASAFGGCVHLEADQYVSRVEKRFTTSGAPELTLATFDGAIEIRTWDRPEVFVEIERRAKDKATAEAIEIKAEQTGARIHIEARRPAEGVEAFGMTWRQGTSARFIATVPRQCNLVVRSGDGSIVVDGIRGRIELRSSDGAIRGADLSGEVYAVTDDGSVKLDAVDGQVDVRTMDGSIVVTGRLGGLKAKTDDGSVSVRAERGSAMSDDWDVSTDDGGVLVELPDDFSADLDLHTTDGAIRGALIEQVEQVEREDRDREGRRSSERSLRVKLGSGGRTLRVRSGDGSIRVGRS